jgi:hypothetical protein
LGVALFGLTCLMGASPVYRDELACEEALLKLTTCCGPDHPMEHVSCSRGFDCGEQRPDIPEERSARILELSCDEVLAGGYCIDPTGRAGDQR